MTHRTSILDTLSGRQVLSLAMCARYSSATSCYGFSVSSDAAVLGAAGLVEDAGFGAYRATDAGRSAVAGLSRFDEYAALALYHLPWSDYPKHRATIERAYRLPFDEARKVIRTMGADAAQRY